MKFEDLEINMKLRYASTTIASVYFINKEYRVILLQKIKDPDLNFSWHDANFGNDIFPVMPSRNYVAIHGDNFNSIKGISTYDQKYKLKNWKLDRKLLVKDLI